MMCFLVPSMAQLIVAHPSFATADLSSISLCAIGSAPLPPATLVAMQERMPEASVSNSYGMTEAGPAYCAMPKGESLNRIGSVGQPMPPLEVRFLDEDGHELTEARSARWPYGSRDASASTTATPMPQPGPGREVGCIRATSGAWTTTGTSISSVGRRT